MSRRWASLVWVAAALACGGTVTAPSESDTLGPDASPGGASAGREASGAGAPSKDGLAGGGRVVIVEPSAPTTPAEPPLPEPHPARPCENPRPLSSGGGFIICADGSLRRPASEACLSSVPRSEPASGRIYEECVYDADCADQPNGYCAVGACFYGCTRDSECEPGASCACGELIGSCASVGCRSDADCPDGYPCTGVFSAPGVLGAFHCQSPYDECLVDEECNAFDAAMHCELDGERRLCVRRKVE